MSAIAIRARRTSALAESQNTKAAQSVLNSFRTIVKWLRQADRAGLKEHGLGASQLYVIHTLRQESPLSVNDLAERMATDQSTVSVVVSKLITKGLVARERAEDDARRLDLTLTARGHLVARRLPPPIQSQILQAVERLPAARSRALAQSLAEICSALGIDEEMPPMLFADAPARAPKKAVSPRKRTTPRK